MWQRFIQAAEDLTLNPVRCPAKIGFRNRPSDAGQRIGIPAERNGIPEGVFEVLGFEKGDRGNGDRALTTCVEVRILMKIGKMCGTVVAEPLRQQSVDFVLACSRATKKNRSGHGLRVPRIPSG